MEQIKTIPGARPPGGLGMHNLDTNMAIYTNVSSNYTHICPIIRHFRRPGGLAVLLGLHLHSKKVFDALSW